MPILPLHQPLPLPAFAFPAPLPALPANPHGPLPHCSPRRCPTRCYPTRRSAPSLTAHRPTTPSVSTSATNPTSPDPSPSLDCAVRPVSVKTFSTPFSDSLVVRQWTPRDRLPTIALLSTILPEFGLVFEPEGADADVVHVPSAYKHGEFWVVEDISSAQIVATAAFTPVPSRPSAVEIRKMYLHPSVRRMSLATFLLAALEHRAIQSGFSIAIIETASVLHAAVQLYQSNGYSSSSAALHTTRCDVILEKTLLAPKPHPKLIEVADATRGWTVCPFPRHFVVDNRLLMRAVAVLVQTTDGRVLTHRRSQRKASFAGKTVALITGCFDWGDVDPLSTAKREVMEEVGLDGLTFEQPFEPFIPNEHVEEGIRILFHPFVATGEFTEENIVCKPDEVECGTLMTREEILERDIGGKLWAHFRSHGL